MWRILRSNLELLGQGFWRHCEISQWNQNNLLRLQTLIWPPRCGSHSNDRWGHSTNNQSFPAVRYIPTSQNQSGRSMSGTSTNSICSRTLYMCGSTCRRNTREMKIIMWRNREIVKPAVRFLIKLTSRFPSINIPTLSNPIFKQGIFTPGPRVSFRYTRSQSGRTESNEIGVESAVTRRWSAGEQTTREIVRKPLARL